MLLSAGIDEKNALLLYFHLNAGPFFCVIRCTATWRRRRRERRFGTGFAPVDQGVTRGVALHVRSLKDN